MPITKEQYKDMPEYWDYQRKCEYNRETIYEMSDRFEGRIYDDLGPVSLDQIKERLWARIDPSEYEEPPKTWIPKDVKYRFDWETEPKPEKKGRPVVVKSKDKWSDVFDELSEHTNK